jgi:hypothetical protein
MNPRKALKAAAAAILAAGVLAGGITTPAEADGGVIITKAPSRTTYDTGWGFK